MTPEERQRLTQQLTLITAPAATRRAASLPELTPPAEGAEASAEAPAPPKIAKGKVRWSHWRRVRWAILATILLLALLGTGLAEGLAPRILNFGGQWLGLVPLATDQAAPAPAASPGYDVIVGSPTITFAEVERVLERVGSPMLAYAGDVYAYGLKYHIDPVFALAFWMKESREASDGSVAAVDHNPGYTEGLGSDYRCGRWACWPTWPEGIEGWYHYMRVFFIDGRGLVTIESILPIYAPSSENNTSGYIVYVLQMAANWRAESAANG